MNKNLLSFDCAIPLHTRISPCDNNNNNDNKNNNNTENNQIQIFKLKSNMDEKKNGIELPFISLQKNATYELHLFGSCSHSEFNVSISSIPQNFFTIERIQEPLGSAINLLYRFSCNLVNDIVKQDSKKDEIKLVINMHENQYIILDTEKSYLCRIEDNSAHVLRRRSNGILDYNIISKRVSDYSLLHNLFDKIYILNLDYEPHKWVMCRKLFKKHGIRKPCQIQARTRADADSEYKKSYDNWQNKVNVLSSISVMNFESWCIANTIIHVIENDAKKLKLDRILICRDDFFISNLASDDVFEQHLYSGMRRKWDLFEFNNRDAHLAIGFSNLVYDDVISRFKTSPVSIQELFKSLKKESKNNLSIPDLDVDTKSNYELNISNHLNYKDDYITIMIYVSPHQFLFDPNDTSTFSVLYPFIKAISKQNYPWFHCFILARDKKFQLEDSRFQVVNIDKIDNNIDKIKIQDVFGIYNFPATRYISTFHNLNNHKIINQLSNNQYFFSNAIVNSRSNTIKKIEANCECKNDSLHIVDLKLIDNFEKLIPSSMNLVDINCLNFRPYILSSGAILK